MPRPDTPRLNIEIDKLTNSIIHAGSGANFPTDVLPVTQNDLKLITKKNDWNFNWRSEFKYTDRQVYKLVIKDDPDGVIQGLVSIGEEYNYYQLHLIENAPFNFGKRKLYEGVAGNLFAYACKLSWDSGYQGEISFLAKTRLIDHYEKTLGATYVGGLRMIIRTEAAQVLIRQYFSS